MLCRYAMLLKLKTQPFFGASSEPHASAARPRGPRPQADDLDQFHNWLQNLKR